MNLTDTLVKTNLTFGPLPQFTFYSSFTVLKGLRESSKFFKYYATDKFPGLSINIKTQISRYVEVFLGKLLNHTGK